MLIRRSISSLYHLRNHRCHLTDCAQSRPISSRASCHDSGTNYDVIVVGGGHAGTEAACASARLGARTLLVTHKFETVGAMSCNPSFGGIGKGHLMKEIDALDGVCARICDQSGLQYKVLNRSKGSAVWGYRAQIDRDLYKSHLQKDILNTENITVLTSGVEDLLLEETTDSDNEMMKQACHGVVLADDRRIYGKSVVLTTGTFLRGTINVGLTVRAAGRMDDEPAIGLAKSLEDAGFTLGRLKTGTPPRLDRNTIDFSKTTVFKGDNPPLPFSFLNKTVWIKAEEQLDCYITYTNEEVSKIVMETLHLNNHVREEISGPRNCPSLETKVLRYREREHVVWLEPEGFSSDVIYPNGISCTMPEEHQLRLVRCIKGLEKAKIIQPGYGVEYDFIDPRQLKPSLETLRIQNLFFAGQINGTTGYEEAAAQGIIAGINAASKVQNKPAFTLDRTESYIGVLIDDLTTQGAIEPYRMYTSNVEFRLSLRPDNADFRLTEKGYKFGCVSQHRYEVYQRKYQLINKVIGNLRADIRSMQDWNKLLGFPRSINCNTHSAFEVLRIPKVCIWNLSRVIPDVFQEINDDASHMVHIQAEALYGPETEYQRQEIEELRKDESLILPQDLDYYRLNLPHAATEKLHQVRPASIAAASRIPGMNPAILIKLLKHVKQKKKEEIFY